MPIEIANTISELNDSWPLSGDPTAEGDNHLRLTKGCLKSQFPGENGNGFETPILSTETELNYSQGLTGNIQNQLDQKLEGNDPQVDVIVNSITVNTINLGSWVISENGSGALTFNNGTTRFTVAANGACTASGALSGASVASSGAVTGATLTTTGNIAGNNIAASGTVTAGGNITAFS